MRLITIPYAFGNANIFLELFHALEGKMNTTAVEYAGHGRRITDELHTKLEDVVSDVYEQIEGILDSCEDYCLLGYSMGSTVAYYLYFFLKERGISPKHLYFMANTPPYVPDEGVPSSELSDDAFLKEMSDLGGLPQEVLECKELVDLFLPIMRADVRLEESGLTSEPSTIDCNMSVIYSTQDDEGGKVEQWRRCAGMLCDFHQFEGTHFFMLEHYADVAEIINRTLR